MTRRIKWALLVLCLATLALLAWREEARSQEPASAAIVMAIDYSGSIKTSELEWQLGGLIQVFADEAIERRLEENERGWVAVTVFRFGAVAEQPPAIPWVALRAGDGSIAAFRLQLQALMARGTEGFRSLGDGTPFIGRSTGQDEALRYALELMATAPPSDRQIINLQTDEANGGTYGGSNRDEIRGMRALAWAANIILNVIIIGEPDSGDSEQVYNYHMRNTVTGMVWVADDYESYLKALQTKILGEIS